MPEILQDVRKRNDKARSFAPPDIDEGEILAKLTKGRIKTPDDIIDQSSIKRIFDKIKKPKDLEMDKFLKIINKCQTINLHDVDNLIYEIERNITERDNIVDLGNNKEIYFRDLNNFLYDIRDGKISDFNKEREYEKRLTNSENKLENTIKYNNKIRSYKQYLNDLKKNIIR